MKNPVKKNMDKFHKPRTHKDHTKYDRKRYNRGHSHEFLKIDDPVWAEVCEIIDDMDKLEKMEFLRLRIGSERLDKMDRDEYDGVIGSWLLEEMGEF